MQVLFLLLMGLLPLITFCQKNRLIEKVKIHSLDTLGNYSYLLVGLQKRNTDTTKSKQINNSSGFFIRDTSNRLFLVSAYHVFSGVDIYGDSIVNERADSLQVWYKDTLGNYKFQNLSLEAYKKDTSISFTKKADLATMNVSGYFKDGKIFSIEHMAPHYWLTFDNLHIGDTLICYGFSKHGWHKIRPQVGKHPLKPKSYTSHTTILPEDLPKKYHESVSNSYMAIHPAFKSGYSGAPVFRIKSDSTKRIIVEFAGIQSGSDTTFVHSLIVMGRELGKIHRWK